MRTFFQFCELVQGVETYKHFSNLMGLIHNFIRYTNSLNQSQRNPGALASIAKTCSAEIKDIYQQFKDIERFSPELISQIIQQQGGGMGESLRNFVQSLYTWFPLQRSENPEVATAAKTIYDLGKSIANTLTSNNLRQ